VLLFKRWQKQMRASASESPDAKIREVVANYIDRFGDSRLPGIRVTRKKSPNGALPWRVIVWRTKFGVQFGKVRSSLVNPQ
jgi:hypothetical protein